MTIAITLKVNDGVVVASDSATTMDFGGEGNVYNHADKLFNLHKGTPIAAVGFGLGNIGPASLATLMKDLRVRFSDAGHAMHIDPKTYSIEGVAKAVRDFLFDEHYKPLYESVSGLAKKDWPYLGMMISGYSAGESKPEVWRVVVGGGDAKVTPDSKREALTGFTWGGDGSAVQRLILGFDWRLPEGLAKEMNLQPDVVRDAVKKVAASVEPLFLPSSMPIQDVIDFAHFLVDMSAKYSRYTPGYQTIGGPIDIAAVTKHEGFKWVRRKHYYDAPLNPHL
jgi:hypothetical protein